jgi:hypothetical protein
MNRFPCWNLSRPENGFRRLYFFLPALCLAATACALLWLALLALACFCEDFF